MTTQQYLDSISKRYNSGISKEHSYRGDLEVLIRDLVPGVEITNEPANVTDCGNPDYVITEGKIPIGYIEAKDIGKDLNGKQYTDQFSRYKKALDNLLITDYVWFRFYQHGELVHEVRIGEIEGGKIVSLSDNYSQFENLIQNFCTFVGQTIKSPKKLAEMMAAKAKLLENILESAISSDEVTQENTSLKSQYDTFKRILINDLTPKGFADIYAQTLAYGMFAARLHDTTLDNFTRQEAAELIPKSNPFLRKLFGYIAGPEIDERIKRTVDNLAEVFRATNVNLLLKNFGKSTQTTDPIIHFYETFLTEYDPKLRKSRGVWYTPEPVVNFIVRAVDDILKTEFGLKDGLADTSKTKIKVPDQGGKKQIEKEVHKVQILDPATGTGTFLAEVVKHIYNNKFKSMQGAWSGYVEEHLIPRLNGFELLMASYSMAHLKLDMLLTETGYKPTKDQRFNIYLTNSLEEHHPDTGTLFSNWLSTEANEANHIKRDTPVMCVIGNPPYSGESANKGKWIMKLMEDYKTEPGGKQKLNERNPKWINDDYVKFIRYGQNFIEKNGMGVLAFINPHGFLGNPTFRGMRWQLLKTYDKIYTIDLHGNSNIKEKCPDGSSDNNVFDIQQGVAITLFIKTGIKKFNELGKVYHFDLYGKREYKYDFLKSNSLKNIPYKEIVPTEPMYFFVYRDYKKEEKYNAGFSLNDFFNKSSIGFQTHRDSFAISFGKTTIYKRMKDMLSMELTDNDIQRMYSLKDNRDWKMQNARSKIKNDLKWEEKISKCTYRPLDSRYCYYSDVAMDYPRDNIGSEVLDKDNIVLNFPKIVKTDWNHCLLTDSVPTAISLDINGTYFAPLYVYSNDDPNLVQKPERLPNLNHEIVNLFIAILGIPYVYEKESKNISFSPIDIIDYIYAMLHSPTYRAKYNEFLKTDFPRAPYPKDKETFWKLVKLGGELRQIHLLESPKTEHFITSYPVDGDHNVVKPVFKEAKVWINNTQYFDGVPEIAWNFYIGGYQPAQKWLKDRKGRKLNTEDIFHYQKIIVALSETDRLMKEIDKIEIE